MIARVSVLIPVYKGEEFVAQAVASALAQTHADVEIIIVNDGSPDGSRRALAPFLDLPNVKYIEKKNGGVASARNAALQVATGDYIALLDQDDLWVPHKLARQIAMFEQDSSVALVHADVTYIAADGSVLPRDPYFPKRVEGNCFSAFFMANPVMACTAVVRRSVLTDIGGFDETIRFADDYDLWLRIVRHHAVAYVDDPLAMYRVHASNESKKTVGIVSATMQVLRKALKTLPECAALVGPGNIDVRFARLECAISRHYFLRRHWGRFAQHWLKALARDRRTTFQLGLPAAALDRLQWYSKKLGLR